MTHERRPIENDPDHDEYRITPSSATERDLYLRTFPVPMPSTHRLAYRWEANGGLNVLVIRPVRTPEAEKAVNTPLPPKVEADPDQRPDAAPQQQAYQQMSKPQLLTLAAEK